MTLHGMLELLDKRTTELEKRVEALQAQQSQSGMVCDYSAPFPSIPVVCIYSAPLPADDQGTHPTTGTTITGKGKP